MDKLEQSMTHVEQALASADKSPAAAPIADREKDKAKAKPVRHAKADTAPSKPSTSTATPEPRPAPVGFLGRLGNQMTSLLESGKAPRVAPPPTTSGGPGTAQ